VCINVVPTLWKRTGVGRYTDEITKNLIHLNSTLNYKFFYGVFPCSSIYSHKNNIFGITGKILAKLSRKLPFYSKLYDIYWEPNFIPNPKIRSKRCVTTIHDLSFIKFQKMHPARRVKEFKNHFFLNINRSDVIIAVSEYVKSNIINDLNIDGEKIKVIPCGINNDLFYKVTDTDKLSSFRNAWKLPAKYILYVGSIEPRKNLSNLLKAYDSLGKDFKKEYSLVMVGFMGWKNAEIINLINKTNVILIQHATDENLRLFYNCAEMFVYPSLDEGFGLPPIEAMICGTPSVVSNCSSLPEVCGDAAYYVDPYCIDNIADGIYKVITNNELRLSL
ncbi:MAG: hypothetical protein A2329_01420, partial [Sulfurimonas sp. RIFOXYB2_FULL_37_5]